MSATSIEHGADVSSAYEVRTATVDDARELHALLHASGWEHRVPSVDWFAELVARSQRAFVAVAPQGQPVGFVRAITDELSNGYLSMLVVAERHRRRGIGTKLVGAVVAGLPGVSWALHASRVGAAPFFASLGFEMAPLAMHLPRKAP